MNMRLLPLFLIALLITGCEWADELARGSAPEHADAQTVPMDTAGVVARRVVAELPGELTPNDMTLLPDGRSAVVNDWATGDLVLYDLESGTSRNLTNIPDPWESAASYSTRVSPDGETVVYGWEVYSDPYKVELRTLKLSGGTPRTIYSTPDWVDPLAFAPDGRTVAAVHFGDEGAQILLVPIDGGEARLIRTLDWRGPGRVEFSPDGRYLAYDRPAGSDEENSDIYLVDLTTNREHVIVESPADDGLLGWIPGSNELLFTSDRTGTTGAWTQHVVEGRAAGSAVLVRPDFWRASARGFTADGRFFYAVQSAGPNVWTATLDTRNGAVGDAEAVLPEPIAGGQPPSSAWSADGRAIAVAWRRNRGHGSTLTVRSVSSAETRDYPLPNRLNYIAAPLVWSPDGTAVFLRARLGGDSTNAWVLVRVDLATGRSEIFNIPKAGREMFNWFEVLPDGRSVLVRRRINPLRPDEPNVVRLSLRNLDSGTERDVFKVQGSTLPFVLSPDGDHAVVGRAVGLPNRGPQGGQSETRLEWFTIALSGDGQPQKVAEGPAGGGGASLFLESSAAALLQVKPRTSGPINQGPWELHRIPLDGAPMTSTPLRLPEQATTVTGFVLLSPNGDRLSFTSGQPTYELWVLEGLSGSSARPTSGR
jgi:WD40 repeat protein